MSDETPISSPASLPVSERSGLGLAPRLAGVALLVYCWMVIFGSGGPAASLPVSPALTAPAGPAVTAPAATEAEPAFLGGGLVRRGVATWYGREFHGSPTASGEIFDADGLTAAHRTLPLGSYAQVRNLENDRSVVVRINDRGPVAKDRLIDLSYGAARRIEMARAGRARVEVVPLEAR
jgi:rare lipoprotein A